MSQKQHWISLIKAHFLLLLLVCLQLPDLGRCQSSKSTPSDMTLKNMGVTDVTKSPTVTGPASFTGDIGDSETSSALATSTGSPDFTAVDIQPTPSSIFHRDNDSASDLTGETTPVLPSLHTWSTVLPPLPSLTVQPSLDTTELFSPDSESLQSMTPFLTTSTFSLHGTEASVEGKTSLFISSSFTESLSSTSSLHFDSYSSSVAIIATSAHSSTSSHHISSTHSDSSTSTSSMPVFSSSSTASTSHPSTTVSLPHGTSSGGTTPAGILPNTTKVPTTNSSNIAGEEDRLHTKHKDNALTTPAVIGIGFGAAAAALVITGVVLLLLKRKSYRRNKHDSSNFWDDNVTLSYINSHAEFPKDLDAEMMSLDDDSFLNSLDSMTFANLWATDTAKHTNF